MHRDGRGELRTEVKTGPQMSTLVGRREDTKWEVTYLYLQHLEPRGTALEGVAIRESIRLARLPVDGGNFLREELGQETAGQREEKALG
jgi:hypothetical protein